MNEDPQGPKEIPVFCWIVGCAIPINASSVCKYLFDKNNLKPQLKSSLISCQLYASALSHIYHSDKAKWRSFSAVYRQLRHHESDDLVVIKSLCGNLEESVSKNSFPQGTHVAFIEQMMRLCMAKSAPFSVLESEIRRLANEHRELGSVIDLSNLQAVDMSSHDFVEMYGRLLHVWLLAIARITVPELSQSLKPEGVHFDGIIQNLGLISLLSCAAFYYRSRIATLVPSNSRAALLKAPCLDAHLAVLSEENESTRRAACVEDDRLNAPLLFAILGGIFEDKKGTGGRPDPSHISLITAALCTLPYFVGGGEEVFSSISALCSCAILFHWFTGSEWPKTTANQLNCDEPQPATQKKLSSNETALRNSVALQSLVRASGAYAKKARPTNPENIPAAVVDLATVEQLVSSTTSDSSEAIKSSDPIQQEEGLLSELACTAALAVVNSSTVGARTIKVYSKPSTSTLPQSNHSVNTSMNAFYLNKTHEVANGAAPTCATFKLASSSKNLSKSSIPQFENSSANKVGLQSSSVSPEKGIVSSTKQLDQAGVPSSRNTKTNWSERARHQDEEKRSRSLAPRTTSEAAASIPSITPAEMTGSNVGGVKGAGSVAALRLSLEQQRRTIEANRRHALRHGDRAAAQRNQAAFKALLRSSQKRHREGTNSEEPPSLAEEEESESFNKFNDESTVSQSDIQPEESIEEEIVEGKAVKDGNVEPLKFNLDSSTSPAPDVETTDMEDFSSSVPDQVEILSNVGPTDSPIQCTSPPPMESPEAEDMSTPRVNRRPSPCSTSSPSLPSDELESEEHRSVSGKRNIKRNHSHQHRHRRDYNQLASSIRSHPQTDGQCSQCSHCATQNHYGSIPLHRAHGSRLKANGDDGDSEGNYDYEEYYGTLPARRVSKPPSLSRRTARSVKDYHRGRGYSPEDPEEVEDSFVNETASEIYWTTPAGRKRTSSRQRLHQRLLDALDSGEEFSSTLPPRPHRLESNHLGKSTGTGLDALVLVELARSVTSLRSDIERLTAQQLYLRSDLQEVDLVRPVGSARSSSRLNLTNTPSNSTRAMWSSRTPLGYPSQWDVRENVDPEPKPDQENELDEQARSRSPDRVTDENEPPGEASTSIEVKQPELAPDIAEASPTALVKPPPSEPEVKPAETLFITFENPSSERLQRARERLEARRAADRSRLSESALRARMAGREAQVMAEISAMTRNAPSLPADSAFSADAESENSGFPVHTTHGDGVGEVSLGSSITHPRSVRPSSARNRQTSAAATARNASTGIPSAASTNGGGSLRASRSASLTQFNTRRSVTSSSENRPATGSHVTSTNGRQETASANRQRSASRPSAGQLSNGPSLSSLHRLENGEESTYSGPGLPIAGNYSQPRLYVKPKSKSNRQVIVNAISHCCLAGTVNEPAKKLALQELAAVDGSHFIVLFRDSRCQYRALYAFDFDTEELKFICGNGPRKITHSMCDKFFKYNSGAKQFSEITSTKHLSAVVDAVTIQNSWWLRNPPLHSNAARTTAAAVPTMTDVLKQ